MDVGCCSIIMEMNINVQSIIKRFLDLTLGLILLTISFPLLIMVAMAIKMDSRGPVLFIQPRFGRCGQTFHCYKFRTMVSNAQEVLMHTLQRDPAFKKDWQAHFKLKSDPRITRVGRFLRKTSLDELPQIINVLRGQMSLVGPRPRPLYELDGGAGEQLFKMGLTVRPGITGLWQVSGRNELSFAHRVWLDAFYAQNQSLRLDLLILLKTIGAVIKQRGAH